MKEIYVKHIAETLQVQPWQVENCIILLEEGNTMPFISRYRKEKTGGLDDGEVAAVNHSKGVFEELEKRKETVLSVIEGQGKLTAELRSQIESCLEPAVLEDLYLPFRPKRRTRATVAKEAGLEPLADLIFDMKTASPSREASKFLSDKVGSVDDALQGARDIIAERISETPSVRQTLRGIFSQRWVISKVTKEGQNNPEAAKYRSYFDFKEPLQKIASHRLLAILRGEEEGFLNVKIDALVDKCSAKIYYDFCKGKRYPAPDTAQQLKESIEDSFTRLLYPSISREVIKECKAKADAESIRVFGDNLRQLLLSPPVGQKRTLAIDPGFRNGCKMAVLDEQGNLLHHTIIYPHPPQSDKVKSLLTLENICEKYRIQAIAIGNGTASRETEEFLRRVELPEGCKVYTVSEDGASIYSASEVAREEFPDYDVTVRGAVSIGRRLMDPLSELVKIDPRSLGVGQYQHDVDQALLKEELDNTVESCVNLVGVNLNTASPYLLRYVSGIGPSLSQSIVAYRTKNGPFPSREALRKVPRLGDKAFEQCAAFLRIPDAKNPLDNSAVHPESYHIVAKMARDLGVSEKKLLGDKDLLSRLKPEQYVEKDFGLPTVSDIIKELAKPGLDPREGAQEFSFDESVKDIEDLYEGMELPGIITNVTAFGAFVDIGIHENGLIHVSQMRAFAPGRGSIDPSKVVKLHQYVRVRVLGVDLDRKRVSLSLIGKD